MDRRAFVWLASAAALGAAGALAGCSAGGNGDQVQTVTLCLEGSPDAYDAGVLLAQSLGLFSDDGLALQVVTPDEGLSSLDMVNLGRAQFGISSQEALASAFAVDEPASVAAVAAVVQHDITDDVVPSVARTPGYAKRDSYAVLVIANDAFLVNAPDESIAVLDALSRAYRKTASNPAAAAKALSTAADVPDAARLRADVADVAASLLSKGGSWGRIDQKRWDAFFSWLHERGAIDRAIPAHHGFIMDYLLARKKSSGSGAQTGARA